MCTLQITSTRNITFKTRSCFSNLKLNCFRSVCLFSEYLFTVPWFVFRCAEKMGENVNRENVLDYLETACKVGSHTLEVTVCCVCVCVCAHADGVHYNGRGTL